MKKILAVMLILPSILFSCAYAGGGRTHMYIAQQAIKHIPDKTLRNLLEDNIDAYMVGAYYPDSGYTDVSHHGDVSHSRAFHRALADVIRGKYSDPVHQKPRLVAFLIGTAAHAAGDDDMHYVLYPEMRQHDFKKEDDSKVHMYGDVGIDLLVTVDKSRWSSPPTEWWLPLSDIMAAYKKLGHDDITETQVIEGNKVISIAGLEENIIALPAYPYLWWKMPWTTKNYDKAERGGLFVAEQKVATYEMQLWQYLNEKEYHAALSAPRSQSRVKFDPNPIKDIGLKALHAGAVMVKVKHNSDGSVNLDRPIVQDKAKLTAMLKHVVAWIKNI